MHGVEFQQMRVHRRVADRVVDPGDLAPRSSSGFRASFPIRPRPFRA
jgi:hypothetical protein